MTLSTQVEIKLVVLGSHCWKDAPDYLHQLRNEHMHYFYIRLRFDVAKSRDIEFFDMAAKIKSYMEEVYPLDAIFGLQFGGLSCECIASALLCQFDAVQVSVHEDDQNGAIVTR